MWILRDVHVRRWEKRNRSNVYWRIMKVCVSSIQDGVLKNFTFLGIEKIWTISSLYIIFLIFDFLFLWKKSDDFYPKIFQYSQTKICPRWLMYSQGTKCFNTPIFYTTLLKWEIPNSTLKKKKIYQHFGKVITIILQSLLTWSKKTPIKKAVQTAYN